MQAKNAEITRLNNVYQEFVLGNAGVKVIQGIGQLDGKNAVKVHMTETGEEKF